MIYLTVCEWVDKPEQWGMQMKKKELGGGVTVGEKSSRINDADGM